MSARDYDAMIASKVSNHQLKTWPQFFEDIMHGLKTFEVRRNDRGFKVGDILELVEYDPGISRTGRYTGRKIIRRVNYILEGGDFGLAEGFIVMGIEPP